MIKFHKNCPRCNCKLKTADDTRRYETFDQHVGRPGTPIHAHLYKKCPNESCPLNAKYFWGMDGIQYHKTAEGK